MKTFRSLITEPDEHIDSIALYRTVGIERLLQLITEKNLTLLEPGKWEDPYEKALQNLATAADPSERPGVFGLCWTTKARSDAFWRIYSPNKLGVRISTTVGRLRAALAETALRKSNPDTLFLGTVTYLPETSSSRNLFDFGKSPLGLRASDFQRGIVTIADAIEDMSAHRATPAAMSPRNIAKALFMKRMAFDHEQEVRLLYVDTTQTSSQVKDSAGLHHLKIDPTKLIRGIQFDPRLADDIYAALRNTIQKMLDTKSIRITRSTLYKDPLQILNEKK